MNSHQKLRLLRNFQMKCRNSPITPATRLSMPQFAYQTRNSATKGCNFQVRNYLFRHKRKCDRSLGRNISSIFVGRKFSKMRNFKSAVRNVQSAKLYQVRNFIECETFTCETRKVRSFISAKLLKVQKVRNFYKCATFKSVKLDVCI